MKPTRANRIGVGIAGEYFVAGELAKRGWIATLTAKNTPAIDIVAVRQADNVLARVQVKSRSPAYRRAHRVGQLTATDGRDFVVLVDIGDSDESPRYWIVPAAIAIDRTKNDQLITDEISEFEGRWDLLDG